MAEPVSHALPGAARWRRLAAGLLVSGVALAAQWAMHRADGRVPYAPYSAAQWAVDHAPGGLATSAIDTLGHAALQLTSALALVGALVAGGASGLRGTRAFVLVSAGGTIVAGILDPQGPPLLGILVAAAAPAVAACLLPAAAGASPRWRTVATGDVSRRDLLRAGAGAGLLVAAGVGSVVWAALHRLATGPVHADEPAAVAEDPAFDAVAGLTPAVTGRDDHYIVAIDLDAPRIDAASWRLRVGGSVRRPLSLGLDDLRAMSTVEQLVMLSCISNQVGGGLTGNARWTGVPLHALLQQAGADPSAAALRVGGADGYWDVIPMEEASRPEVLLALAMDGDLLPVEHGFPARLLVPGTYGMKNVKWVTDLTVVDRLAAGYWEERGWDTGDEARTESRFDVPHDHDTVPAAFTAAGIAWAGRRRVSMVEVSTDDGTTWRPARLEAELSPWAWRRWQLQLTLPPGVQALVVRAHDGHGVVQDATRRPPHPAGASGYHRVVVSVGGR